MQKAKQRGKGRWGEQQTDGLSWTREELHSCKLTHHDNKAQGFFKKINKNAGHSYILSVDVFLKYRDAAMKRGVYEGADVHLAHSRHWRPDMALTQKENAARGECCRDKGGGCIMIKGQILQADKTITPAGMPIKRA